MLNGRNGRRSPQKTRVTGDGRLPQIQNRLALHQLARLLQVVQHRHVRIDARASSKSSPPGRSGCTGLSSGDEAVLVRLAVNAAHAICRRPPPAPCSSTASDRGRPASWCCPTCSRPAAGSGRIRRWSPAACRRTCRAGPCLRCSAESERSSTGQCRFFSGPKLAACVSQASTSGSPFATDGQFNCTKRVPASIRRRESSSALAERRAAVAVAHLVRLFAQVEGVARLAGKHQIERLLVVFVERVGSDGLLQIRHRAVDALAAARSGPSGAPAERRRAARDRRA